jgi:hypothetical protein
MSYVIRKVFYFYTTVEDKPGEAYKLLTALADIGINLLAFTAVPIGPLHTQLSLFPDDKNQMMDQAKKTGLKLDGPYPALLIQGDDELGALAEVHESLYQAGVNIFASNGVSNGKGHYGYLIYVRPEDHDRASKVLGI